MKTSTQWLAILADSDTAKRACEVTECDIAAIQADALRHAAQIAVQLNDTVYANEGIRISDEIEAQADKLEGK